MLNRAWLALWLVVAALAQRETCEPSQLGYDCKLPVKFSSGVGWIHYSWDTTDGPPNNVCSGNGGSPSLSNERMAHWAVEGNYPGYISLAFAEDGLKMNPCEAVIGGVEEEGGDVYMSTYRFTTYEATTPHGPDKNWGFNMGAAQDGGTTTICFSTRMPSGANQEQSNIPPELAEGGLLDLHWATHTEDDPKLRHREKGSVQLNPFKGTLIDTSAGTSAYVLAHSILMAIAFVVIIPVGIMIARHRCMSSTATKQTGSFANWFLCHGGLQILGTACFLASVGIGINKLGGSYPSESEDLGEAHRVIGILLIPLMCIQLLMGLFPRPKPASEPGASMPKTRLAWNIIHHNWGRITYALAIANVYIGIVLYVRIWSGQNEQSDLSAWIASVTVVLGVLLVVEICLTVMAIVQQNRAKRSDEHSAELAAGKDAVFVNKAFPE